MPELPDAPGLRQPGNISDIWDRPILKNRDASISTTRSMNFGSDEGETLIPTVINGKSFTPEQAINEFRRTGQHLGIFDTPENAEAYAQALHNAQAEYLQSKGLLPQSLKPGWGRRGHR